MSNHPFDTLELASGSKFIFTPCPGTKDASLADSVTQLKQAGAEAIITLMYEPEINELGASALPELCAEQGLKWINLPISDDAAPNGDFIASWQQNLAGILSILQRAGTVAVHCKGGSGRTGLVIGLLMTQLGLSKQEAKQKVQSVRPKALVNAQQLAFFEAF